MKPSPNRQKGRKGSATKPSGGRQRIFARGTVRTKLLKFDASPQEQYELEPNPQKRTPAANVSLPESS